jgi:hypothetical protein
MYPKLIVLKLQKKFTKIQNLKRELASISTLSKVTRILARNSICNLTLSRKK